MPLLVSILQVSADVGATLLSQCSSCARRLVLSAELSFVPHFILLFTLLPLRLCTENFLDRNAKGIAPIADSRCTAALG
jgi:hypothetical protein